MEVRGAVPVGGVALPRGHGVRGKPVGLAHATYARAQTAPRSDASTTVSIPGSKVACLAPPLLCRGLKPLPARLTAPNAAA